MCPTYALVMRSGMRQCLGDLCDQLRATIDQPRVDLHQRRAGGNLFLRVGARHDAAHADDGQGSLKLRGECANYCG